MLSGNETPFPDNPVCKLCLARPCKRLFSGRVYPGKMIFVHNSDFVSLPCHTPNLKPQEESAGEAAALTDDIKVVTGKVEITNPRWEAVSEAAEGGDPEVPMRGDKVRLLADVKNYPNGAPVSFDIYDVTGSTPLRIATVKGSNDNGKASAVWTVEDPQKQGEKLKLSFEAGAKSKYTQKADLPWKDKIRCDFVEMPDVLFHHNSAVPCLDAEGVLLGALTAAFVFAKESPDKEIVIFGHADTSGDPAYNYDLSQWRAEGIKALLDNKSDAWLDVVDLASKVEDYQTILKALNAAHGWDCDPGNVDNADGPQTKAAVKAFQEQYNEKFSGNLKTDGVMGPKTWEALFAAVAAVVKAAVKDELGTDSLPTLAYGYGGKGIYACGESFPIDSAEKDGYKSATNRRVEMVFFDKGKVPELKEPADKKKVEKKEAPVYDKKKAEKKPVASKKIPNSKGEVLFSEEPLHLGGFDLFEKIKGEDQNGTATSDVSAKKISYVSIEKNTTGKIRFRLKNVAKEDIYFTCDDASIAEPVSQQPAADSGTLEIKAKEKDKAETLLCARLKSTTGTVVSKIGIVVLKKLTYEAELFKVKDSKSDKTKLKLASATGGTITANVKKYYKQAVSELVVIGGNSELDSDFDTSKNSIKNGCVDLEPGVDSDEQKIIKKLCGKSAKTKIVYVHKLRWSYFLREDAPKGASVIKLKNYGSTYLGYIGTNEYKIEDADGTSESINVKSIDTTTGDITIDGKLKHGFTKAKKSVLIWPLGGLSGDPVWVSDVGSEDDLANYCAHELGHQLAGWSDVCEIDNVMFGGSTTGKKLRHQPLKNYYDTSKTSTQWLSMRGR